MIYWLLRNSNKFDIIHVIHGRLHSVPAVFAGKIDYPKYKFFDKQIIRFIMYVTKGPTDISKVYEFTEWDRIDEFAKDLYQSDMI